MTPIFANCLAPSGRFQALATGFWAEIVNYAGRRISLLSPPTISLNKKPKVKFSPSNKYLVLGSVQGLAIWELNLETE